MIRFTDPSGMPCEVFCGPSVQFENPFHSPRAISGFVTGEQGVGHIVVAVPDIQKSLRFYCEELGFRISDTIDMNFGQAKVTMVFLHCNPRHHTLALVPIPAPKRLHRFMLQLRSIDDVGATMYLVQDTGVELTATLGRHTNDHSENTTARAFALRRLRMLIARHQPFDNATKSNFSSRCPMDTTRFMNEAGLW
jgi:biphenyl-2,3-diol 1,2-dioxygenase